jgi:hypothetical protein
MLFKTGTLPSEQSTYLHTVLIFYFLDQISAIERHSIPGRYPIHNNFVGFFQFKLTKFLPKRKSTQYLYRVKPLNRTYSFNQYQVPTPRYPVLVIPVLEQLRFTELASADTSRYRYLN